MENLPCVALAHNRPSETSIRLFDQWEGLCGGMSGMVPLGNVGPILVVAICEEAQWHKIRTGYWLCIQQVLLRQNDFRELAEEYQAMRNTRNVRLSKTVPKAGDHEQDWIDLWKDSFFQEAIGVEVGRSEKHADMINAALEYVRGRVSVIDLSCVALEADPPGLGPFLARNESVLLKRVGKCQWVASARLPDPVFEDRLRNRMPGYDLGLVRVEREQLRAVRQSMDHGLLLCEDRQELVAESEAFVIPREAGEPDWVREENQNVEAQLHYLLARAMLLGASDIHFEEGSVRVRKDGVLIPLMALTIDRQKALVSVVKGLAGMDQANIYTRQDGAFTITMESETINIRASAIPVKNHLRNLATQKVVLRLLPKESTASLSFESLGFSAAQMGKLRHAVSRPQGLVLITGPTGSGKTTTIYGLLKELVRGTRNIITLEDPVEYELAGVNQTQLDPMRGLTIQEFRKGYVRQDPDVLFLGEIRDYDTASFALEASLTGHLVISTLHTESAAGAIYRLISLGVHAEILSQSLLLLQAQRLVRKLCPVCKRAQLLTEIVDRKRWQDYFLRAKMSVPDRLFCPVGCPRCQHTGYLGRAVLTEMIPVCKLMAQAIAVARVDNLFKIRETAAAIGIKTLFEDALRLLSQGVIPIQEAELYGDPWENYEQGNSQTTNPV